MNSGIFDGLRLQSQIGGVRSDAHVHTAFSSDSSASVEDMLDAALKMGLEGLCITDHMDYDFPSQTEEETFLFDACQYFEKLTDLKKKYGGRLEVRIGVELGLQPHLGRECTDLLKNHEFDFVIGSVHLVNGMDPYYGKPFEGQADADVYRQALQETKFCIENVTYFDVLGHLDYIVRYGKHKEKEYSYRTFADEIDEVLNRLIVMGKGLEVNTGGLKYGLGFTNPHPDVLKRYRELGGEIVTVGSDAHKPEHVGYEFEKATCILKECGFRYYAEYRKRQPFFMKL